jgi:uncharacterized protein YjbJ (UPF0337 family)
MAQDKVKGKTNEVVGAGRRKAGEMTGNEKMEAKGAAQEGKGKAQQAVGNAKDAAKNAADTVKKSA